MMSRRGVGADILSRRRRRNRRIVAPSLVCQLPAVEYRLVRRKSVQYPKPHLALGFLVVVEGVEGVEVINDMEGKLFKCHS